MTYYDDIPLNVQDCSDIERYLAANLQKIASSKYLLSLLKTYLDEPDPIRREMLAAEITLNINEK